MSTSEPGQVVFDHLPTHSDSYEALVYIPAGVGELEASLQLAKFAKGVIVFLHERGGSRHSSRIRYIAQKCHDAGYGLLLVNLPDGLETSMDTLQAIVDWMRQDERIQSLPLGLFGINAGGTLILQSLDRIQGFCHIVLNPDIEHTIVLPNDPVILKRTLWLTSHPGVGSDNPFICVQKVDTDDAKLEKQETLSMVASCCLDWLERCHSLNSSC
jgi:hypothetical protein